jgi:hypothetical protein
MRSASDTRSEGDAWPERGAAAPEARVDPEALASAGINPRT